MTTIHPPFPSAVDSTMIKTFRGCHQKFFREYMQHWKTKSPSIHLHAGQAFARGLEVAREAFYVHGMSQDDAIATGGGELIKAYGSFPEPHDTAKTLPRMLGALDYALSEAWPMESDPVKPWVYASGKHAIEFSFASPLPFDHPETGDPVLYTGRADMIAEMDGGLWIEDDKTTSQLGDKWVNQWELRSQFTGYTWAARQVAGIPVDGCLVRGVSILKTKYDHAQCPTYRPAWMVEQWLMQVIEDLHAMVACWKAGYWDYNLDEECNSYGGCAFKRICSTPPENRAEWLEADFEHRVWDPLTRVETKLEDQQ